MNQKRDWLGGKPLTRRDVLKAGAAGIGLGALPARAAWSGSRPSTTGKTTTVKFQGWDYQPQLVQQNITHFQQLNPNLKVDYTAVVSAQYINKMTAEFTGHTQPDACYVYDDSMAGWVDAGYLQPLDGMPGLSKAYSMLYKENAAAMTYHGKRYGLPYYTDTSALVYNADILQKAGISAPPTTWDELTQQALKIKNAGLVEYPIGFTAQLQNTYWGWWWAMLFGAGVTKPFDKSYNPTFQNSSAMRDLLTWLQDAMNKAKILDPASLTLVSAAFGQAVQAGQYAFDIDSRYSMWTYNDPSRSPKIAGKMKIAMIPSLTGKTKGTNLTTRMYCLTTGTKVKQDAYKLIYYLGGLDKSGQPYTAEYWFKQEGLGFAYKELASQASIKAGIAQYSQPVAVYQELSEVAVPRSVVSQPWYAQWEADNQKTIQAVLTQSMTPSAAVSAMAADARKLKKQYA